ncbi:MAG: hypothetical protein ACWA5A_16460 [Marinibacterium sp.]
MHELEDFGEARLKRPTWARWLTRIMLLICGTLMILVILSQPKIAEIVQNKMTGMSGFLEQPQAETPATPIVRARPKDKVPVNRAGVLSAD